VYSTFIFTLLWWLLVIVNCLFLLGAVSSFFSAFNASRSGDSTGVTRHVAEVMSLFMGMFIMLSVLGGLSLYMGW